VPCTTIGRLALSPSNGGTPLSPIARHLWVNGGRDGAMRRRRRPKLQVEICAVPTQDGVPAGNLHAYRHMDEEEREALLVASLVRILRESADIPPGTPDLPAE